jgi:hypothetical protein
MIEIIFIGSLISLSVVVLAGIAYLRYDHRIRELEDKLRFTREQLRTLAAQQGYDHWHDGLHPPCWQKREG